MKFKTLAIALALTAAPTLSFAMGCNGSKQDQAMSCGSGSTYDSATKTCLPVST